MAVLDAVPTAGLVRTLPEIQTETEEGGFLNRHSRAMCALGMPFDVAPDSVHMEGVAQSRGVMV